MLLPTANLPENMGGGKEKSRSDDTATGTAKPEQTL
jgi:hypothetical protein